MELSCKKTSNKLKGKSTTKKSRTSSDQTTTYGTLPSTSSTLQVPSLISEPSSEPSTSHELPPEIKVSTSGQSSKRSQRPNTLDLTATCKPGTSGASSTFIPIPSTSGETSTSAGQPSTSHELPPEIKVSTRGQSSKRSQRPNTLDLTATCKSGTSGASSTFIPIPSTSGETSTSAGQPSTFKRIIMSVFGRFKAECDKNDNDPQAAVQTSSKGKRAESSKSSCKGKSAKASKSSNRGNFVEYVDERGLKKYVLRESKYKKIYMNDLKKKYGIKEKKVKRPKNSSRVPVVTITRNRPNKSSNPKPILPDIIVKRSAENPEERKRILNEIKDSKSPIWKHPSPQPSQQPTPQPSPGGSKRILPAAQQQVAFRKVQGKAVQEFFSELYALNLKKANEAEEKNAKKKKKKSKTAKLINRIRRNLRNTFIQRPSFLNWNRARLYSPVCDEKDETPSDDNKEEETSFMHEMNDTDSDD